MQLEKQRTKRMSSKTEDKWLTLCELLIAKTVSNEIVWDETSTSDTYLTVVNKNTIAITADTDGDVFVIISNADGKKIDQFWVTYLDAYYRESGHETKIDARMKDLLETIARKASGADEVLDSIIGTLTKS